MLMKTAMQTLMPTTAILWSEPCWLSDSCDAAPVLEPWMLVLGASDIRT